MIEILTALQNKKVYQITDVDTLQQGEPESFPENTSINGSLSINDCSITSLTGCPKYITETLIISNCNKLKNLIGCPEIAGALTIKNSQNFSSFEGCAFDRLQYVRLFNLPKLKNLHHLCKVSKLDIRENVGISDLTKLNRLKLSSLTIESFKSQITKGGLGLITIPSLNISIREGKKMFYNPDAWIIISKYIKQGGNIAGLIDCQSELIENNLDNYAIL